MVAARQPHLSAEVVDARCDSQIVSGDDDAGDDRGGRHAAVHVLDHRSTVDIGERLSWEACRSESSGDDGDDVQRAGDLDLRTSGPRVHVE
jgi:hypothetical protein